MSPLPAPATHLVLYDRDLNLDQENLDGALDLRKDRVAELLSLRAYVTRWVWLMILLVGAVVMLIIAPETIRQIQLQPQRISWLVTFPVALSYVVSLPLVLYLQLYVRWLEKGRISLENTRAWAWALRFQAVANEIVRFNALMLLFYNVVPLLYMALGQHYSLLLEENKLYRYVPQMFILYTPTLMALFLPFGAAVAIGLAQNLLAVPVALSVAGDSLDSALVDAVHNSFLVVLIVLLIKVLLEYADRVDSQNTAIYRTQLLSYQLQLEDKERETLNALVHDKVISALVTALNPLVAPQTAADNAAQSQRLLSQVAADSPTKVENLDNIGQFIELCVHRATHILASQSQDYRFELEVSGVDLPRSRGGEGESRVEDGVVTAGGGPRGGLPPQSVLHAFMQTFEEAVRNCAKHATTATKRRLEFAVEWRGNQVQSLTCHVIDNGPGFDITKVPSSRFGLRRSILGRMREVSGGKAEITSQLGQGTTVKLTWNRPVEVLPSLSASPGPGLLHRRRLWLSEINAKQLLAESREVHTYYREILSSRLGKFMLLAFGLDVVFTLMVVWPHYTHLGWGAALLFGAVGCYLLAGITVIFSRDWGISAWRAAVMQLLALLTPAAAMLFWQDKDSTQITLSNFLAIFLGRPEIESSSGGGAMNMILFVPTTFIVLAAFLLAGGKVNFALRLSLFSAASYLLAIVFLNIVVRFELSPEQVWGIRVSQSLPPPLRAVSLILVVMSSIFIVFASVIATKQARQAEMITRDRYLQAVQKKLHDETAPRLRAQAIAKVKALVDPVFTNIQLEALEGEPEFSPQLLSRCRALEGRLRDMIRSSKLDDEELGDAIEAARLHGVTVRLLDDTPPHSGAELTHVLDWVRRVAVPLLGDLAGQGGEDLSVVIRVALRSSGPSATVVARRGTETLSFNEYK